MFGDSIPYYDRFYTWKDYEAEAARLRTLIEEHKRSDGHRLLDLACGTGMHLPHLREHFEVEGLDIEPLFLAMARERNPGLTFHEGDMTRFDLGQTYDVITCLFSSIGYVRTTDALDATIGNIARHLRPGGVALIEPWFSPDKVKAGSMHVLTVDDPDLKLCRMNRSEVEGNLSVLDMHYLVATEEGVRHFTERHELALFTIEEFAAAGAAADLNHQYLDEGLTAFPAAGEGKPRRRGERGTHVYTQTV
jgi:SAM-dependent methyltransferase